MSSYGDDNESISLNLKEIKDEEFTPEFKQLIKDTFKGEYREL